MRKILQLVFTVLLALATHGAFAQGSTTSSISGVVKDASGQPLPGATVIALHGPSGSKYGNISNVDGRFRIPNMRVGGPYKITVTFVGFETIEQDGVFLTLGQTLNVPFNMRETSTELEAVEVLARRDDIFDGNRTGAETFVGEETINSLPTVSRAIGDFVRFNPQANLQEGSDGFSISLNGMNNRYNSIYIDGAVNNDVFGLAGSGTNGGQTGGAPISIDAIEQFQISLAPFDVRQSGFAGGAINAVTRSGSNEFEGSAYYFVRNQSLAGKTPTNNPDVERTSLPDFTARTTGFRLGGPIIKNKLFFFVNGEIQRDETPQPFDFADYEGASSLNEINALVSRLNELGYDPGPFDNNPVTLDGNRFLAKIDWNISQNHKLSVRHSYTELNNLEAVRSSTRSLRFLNASEFFPSVTNSTAIELNSTFGSNVSNNLIIGATFVRDDRDPSGSDFPYVFIQDGSGSIGFGSEQFSTANQLDQDVITITNNLEIYKGKHTITIGTHNEFYSTYNLFIRQNYGVYEYNSLAQFMNNEPATEWYRSYSLIDNITGDGSAAAAEFNAMQLGFYVQDEFQVTDNFKLTGGVRIDVPIFTDDTPANPEFNSQTIPAIESFGYDLKGAQLGSFVDPQVMFAPRLGFNWDVAGNQKTQIRGGIGVFTSRIPFVWPGGAYNNTGVNVGGDFFGPDRQGNPPNWASLTNPVNGQPWDGRFIADPFNQPQRVQPNSGLRSGQIDLFAADFKLPQVMKINLAVDQKLPWGLIGTVEFMYTDFMNDVLYENLNLKPSTARLEGPDNRPLFNRFDEIDPTYTGIYLGSNTDLGYTYNITAQLQKPFDNGFTASLAYTYGDAWTVFDGTSSQNSSQWRGLYAINGRNVTDGLQRSDFAMGSRIFGQVSYRKEYLGFAATQIALIYNGQSGAPFSYTYNDRGGLTNEDSRERALIYVPANRGEINLVDDGNRTADQQWAELDAFIANDPYLSTRRGQYAERNMSRVPFENILDLRLLQDFYIDMPNGKRNTLQLSLDVFNFTNMLNKDWGRIYSSPFSFELLDFEGFVDGTNIPQYSFPGVVDNDNPNLNRLDDSGFRSSRWQAQIGVRYIFN